MKQNKTLYISIQYHIDPFRILQKKLTIYTISPIEYLDNIILKPRGYSIKTYSTLSCGYYNESTPIQEASWSSYVIDIVNQNDIQSLRSLLHNGLSNNPCNYNGTNTLVHYICQVGTYSMLYLLIEYGCDIRITNSNDGRTPLHYACMRNIPCFDIIELIMKIDIRLFHMTDRDNNIPLVLVPKHNWILYNQFLYKKKHMYWPTRNNMNNGIQPPPPLVHVKPNGRIEPIMKHPLTLEDIQLLASGSISKMNTNNKILSSSFNPNEPCNDTNTIITASETDHTREMMKHLCDETSPAKETLNSNSNEDCYKIIECKKGSIISLDDTLSVKAVAAHHEMNEQQDDDGSRYNEDMFFHSESLLLKEEEWNNSKSKRLGDDMNLNVNNSNSNSHQKQHQLDRLMGNILTILDDFHIASHHSSSIETTNHRSNLSSQKQRNTLTTKAFSTNDLNSSCYPISHKNNSHQSLSISFHDQNKILLSVSDDTNISYLPQCFIKNNVITMKSSDSSIEPQRRLTTVNNDEYDGDDDDDSHTMNQFLDHDIKDEYTYNIGMDETNIINCHDNNDMVTFTNPNEQFPIIVSKQDAHVYIPNIENDIDDIFHNVDVLNDNDHDEYTYHQNKVLIDVPWYPIMIDTTTMMNTENHGNNDSLSTLSDGDNYHYNHRQKQLLSDQQDVSLDMERISV